jgi:hypothetical protein
LTINERVRQGGTSENILEFSQFLLQVGEGRLPVEKEIGNNSIQIPQKYIFPSQSIKDFIFWCYPQNESVNFERNDVAILA